MPENAGDASPPKRAEIGKLIEPFFDKESKTAAVSSVEATAIIESARVIKP